MLSLIDILTVRNGEHYSLHVWTDEWWLRDLSVGGFISAPSGLKTSSTRILMSLCMTPSINLFFIETRWWHCKNNREVPQTWPQLIKAMKLLHKRSGPFTIKPSEVFHRVDLLNTARIWIYLTGRKCIQCGLPRYSFRSSTNSPDVPPSPPINKTPTQLSRQKVYPHKKRTVEKQYFVEQGEGKQRLGVE
jgi:hypothetical protein